MALLFTDGFDHYVTADLPEKWLYTNYAVVNASSGRTGGYAAMQTLVQACPFGSGATAIVGFACKLNTGTNPTEVGFHYPAGSYIYDWNAAQCTVRFSNAGEVVVYNGSFVSGGTELGKTAAGKFNPNVWNYYEVKVLMSQTVGTVTVRINNQEVLALTGKDTCKAAHTELAAIKFFNDAVQGLAVDDVYICDGTGSTCNDFLGDVRVVTLLPQTDAVAAGSNAQFTCSTGSDHGALVDEAAPDDDTTYLYSSTVNHVDSWEYPALGYTGTIKAVAVNLIARKLEAGTRTIAAVTKPASTNRVHATNHYLSTSYRNLQSVYEVNPEDSAAWEVADVDGAEFGIKVTA